MLFNSLQYAVFLPIVVALHYVLPVRSRLWLLLIASYVFYAAWNPVYLALIIALTAASYLFGLAIGQLHERPRASAWLLATGIGANLAALCFYKYVQFIVENVLAAVAWFDVSTSFVPPSPVLPLGLSFFTFEFIHYLVDVHRGERIVRSIPQFALFAAFFPTQVAGPIKRYESFLPQLERPAPFDRRRFGEGLRLIVTGLFKKVALADNLAPLVVTGFKPPIDPALGPAQGDAWLAVLAFAMQIYFDFSGYTNIGRGSALLLGYEVPENFRHPYLAVNVSDFWRRWHISLSTWLRDYLYIPLGGNRRHQTRNLLTTMVLGGIWHGANWTFVAWGALHGVLLAGYWHASRRIGPMPTILAPPITLAGWLLTLGLVCIGWTFFRAGSVAEALTLLSAMAGLSGVMPVYLPPQRNFILAVVIGTIVVEWMLEWFEARRTVLAETGTPSVWLRAWSEIRPVAYTLLLTVTILVRPSSSPTFIYFQF